MKKNVLRIICFPIIAILAAVMIAVDAVYFMLFDLLDPFVHPPIVDSLAAGAAASEGEALAAEIMSEGAVLVRNNGVLPLDADANSSADVYGWGSSHAGWVVGGSGSGQVKQAEPDSPYAATTFVDALSDYGISVNASLSAFYDNYRGDRPGINGTLYTSPNEFSVLVEPDYSQLPAGTSDTAFVVISRMAGESDDAPNVQYKWNRATDETRTYLEISTEEETLLREVAATHTNTIVIINSTNTMELGFLDTIPGIDACLVVGGTGVNAASALPGVIYGDVSPSGRLADTYPYEFESNVNYYNVGLWGEGRYTNGDDLLLVGVGQNAGDAEDHGRMYIDYIENIYVGYKWFETADAEGVWANSSRDVLAADGTSETLTGYDAVVQYPFGYGLSYADESDFSWEIVSATLGSGEEGETPSAVTSGFTFGGTGGDELTLTVRVTNNGDIAAKDVVQLYLTAPYDDTAKIEKSSVSLVALAKTPELIGGASIDLTLSVRLSELASYDAYDVNGNEHSGYELEKGETPYMLRLMTDAHSSKTGAANSSSVGGENGVFEFDVPVGGVLYDASRNVVSKAANTNKFTGDQAYDGTPIDASAEVDGGIDFVSRADMDTSMSTAPARTPDRAISDKARSLHRYTDAMATAWDTATKDIFGNEIGVTQPSFGQGGSGRLATGSSPSSVTELGLELGADYDDERWTSLLAQASRSEMMELVTHGPTGTAPAIDSIGLPSLTAFDGPAQIGGFTSAGYRTTGYPNATVLAQTWNTELVTRFGTALASEGLTKGVQVWYGPAVNIHRSPFGGRNYEYYSEDAVLSGKMCAAAVRGAKNAGMFCYLKHLALYEQESNREALFTWLSEQALREIYLRPFEITMKGEAGSETGIMSAYGRIGAVWTGGSESLITGVLRNEWDYHGAIITDYSDNPSYMHMGQAFRAGGDRFMCSDDSSALSSGSGARFDAQLVGAVKNYAYTFVAAAYQMNNPVAGESATSASATPSFRWLTVLIADVNVLLFFGLGLWAYFLLKKQKRKPVRMRVSSVHRGAKQYLMPDGSIKRVRSDGAVIMVYSDGTTTRRTKQGEFIKIYPDGKAVRVEKDGEEIPVTRVTSAPSDGEQTQSTQAESEAQSGEGDGND